MTQNKHQAPRHRQPGCLSFLGACFFGFLIATILASCGAKSDKDVFVRPAVTVQWQMAAGTLQNTQVSVSTVDAQGLRQDQGAAQIEGDELLLDLAYDSVESNPYQKDPDRFVSQGRKLRASPQDGDDLGFVTVFLTTDDNRGLQTTVALPAKSSFQAEPRLVIRDSPQFQVLQRIPVRVMGPVGAPAVNVRVGIFRVGGGLPLLRQDLEMAAAHWSVTDNFGLSEHPILVSEDPTTTYQLVLREPLGCLYVSPPVQLAQLTTLASAGVPIAAGCGADGIATQGNSPMGAWFAATPRAESDAQDEESFIALNNGSEPFSIELSSPPEEISGFRIHLIPGLDTNAPIAQTITIPSFQSQVQVDPATVGVPPGEEGFVTFWLQDSKDRTIAFLQGKVDRRKPVLQADQLTVASAIGTADVISGQSATKLQLTVAGCQAGEQLWLGFREDFAGADPIPCPKETVLLPVEALQLSLSATGGSRRLFAQKQDAAGNTSLVVSRDVYVDYSGPQTGRLVFGSSFGVISADRRQDDEQFFTTQQLPVNNDNLSQHYFRLASDDLCSSLDNLSGDGADPRGVQVAQVKVGKAIFACGADVALSEVVSDANQLANLTLQLVDLAGNPSEPVPFAINPCGANSRAHVCRN